MKVFAVLIAIGMSMSAQAQSSREFSGEVTIIHTIEHGYFAKASNGDLMRLAVDSEFNSGENVDKVTARLRLIAREDICTVYAEIVPIPGGSSYLGGTATFRIRDIKRCGYERSEHTDHRLID